MFLLTSKQLEKKRFCLKLNLKLKIKHRQTFLSIFFFLGGPIYRIRSIEMRRQQVQIYRLRCHFHNVTKLPRNDFNAKISCDPWGRQ